MNSKGSTVYSTEQGRMCPDCGKAIAGCICKAHKAPADQGAGIARVGRETKGRGGKVVTLVRGLAMDSIALAALGKELRSACGSGGTVKDGVLEIQGDHVTRVAAFLASKGLPVRRT